MGMGTYPYVIQISVVVTLAENNLHIITHIMIHRRRDMTASSSSSSSSQSWLEGRGSVSNTVPLQMRTEKNPAAVQPPIPKMYWF